MTSLLLRRNGNRSMNQDLAKDSRLPSGKIKADKGSHRLLNGVVPTKTNERHPERSPERASNLGESKDEVKDLVQIGLRALVDPENRSFRRMRGRDTAKTLRQDDVPFCGQASFGHPEQVERSNDSLTKACRDTVVALWPRPF